MLHPFYDNGGPMSTAWNHRAQGRGPVSRVPSTDACRHTGGW